MKNVSLTQNEIDALRAAYPMRLSALTKAIVVERDKEMLAHIREERESLESALRKLASA